jgi:hypothetical protein
MILDLYQGYKTKKNVESSISKIQKEKPEFTLDDHIEDQIKRMESSFDEFGISLTSFWLVRVL